MKRILELVKGLFSRWKKPSREAVSVTLWVSMDGKTFKEAVMSTVLGEGDRVYFKLVPKDSKGRIVAAEFIDGVPEWANSNPGGADMIGDANDPWRVEVRYLDGPGVAQISGKIDARLGPDTKLIVGTADVTLLPLEASVVELEASPVDKFPPVP